MVEEILMRSSKIKWAEPWFVITLSEVGKEPEVIFTGNLEYALELAKEWETK